MSTPSDNSLDNSIDLFNDDVDENDEMPMRLLSNVPRNSATNVSYFECPFCDEYASDETHLRKHIQSSHVDNNTQNPTNPGISNFKGVKREDELLGSDIDTFVCPYCSSSHKTKMKLAEHLTLTHGEELEHCDLEDMMRSLDLVLCPLCEYTCSSATEMQQHVDVQHSSRKGSHTNHLGDEVSAQAFIADSHVIMCPVCGLEEPDSDLLTSHIELHFETSSSSDSVKHQGPSVPSTSRKVESVHLSSSSSTASSKSSSSSMFSESKAQDKRKRKGQHYKHQYRQGLEKAVMKGKMSPGDYHDHLAQMQEKDMNGVDDGHSKVEGLIPQLESFYRSRSRDGQSAILCSPLDYYCGSYGDKGWGCGYRNFQMMLSCLSRMDTYSTKLVTDGRIRIPSVPKIQEMIESAWQKGFDREGCLQLEAKVTNTRKWIGATEIVATLSSMGIRCELVDFLRPSSPDGTHPRLLEWVKNYFYKDQSAKPPLYLQHQGHSRTIVGFEVDKGTTRLLLFDPGSSKEHISSLRSGQLNWKEMATFRRTLAGFKAKQYQIVAVVGLLRKEDYEQSKRLTSTRVM